MATPISATPLLEASLHERSKLVDIYELLDKLYVRNRNQHRRNHWWKSLHAFRKQLALLLSEMNNGKRSERAAKIEARLRYWDEKCVHIWYCQFSQLIAVGPFAMLGLVMMASVARLCRITGITSAYEEIASGDIQGVLSANDELLMSSEFGAVMDEEAGWDEGVVIERED
ncbi:RNase MRP subunit [Neodidymelliopsis sp. IMI 364377]|nr:RNase MRP subunit [Neodidymelliopsis sp. IMI 364377]